MSGTREEPMMDAGGERMLLAMWSAPRSRSTAFERMMMERGDFTVLHEPFSHVKDFGTATVRGREVTSERELIAELRGLPGLTFLKDTTDFAYPELLTSQGFLRETVHSFILRHPREVIESHFALNSGLTRDEIGFARLWEIHQAVLEAGGPEPVVVDSDDLLDRPEATVRAFCERVGIPFVPAALQWKPGEPGQWGRTSRWHQDASGSSGFARTEKRYEVTVENDEKLAAFLRYHLPFYERLRERRIRLDCPAEIA
ncbi:sulfotransferase-like domain-containing protein [Streptomyces solincola]|nr:sulfotransferase family protein [Streptomyces solincola]